MGVPHGPKHSGVEFFRTSRIHRIGIGSYRVRYLTKEVPQAVSTVGKQKLTILGWRQTCSKGKEHTLEIKYVYVDYKLLESESMMVKKTNEAVKHGTVLLRHISIVHLILNGESLFET